MQYSKHKVSNLKSDLHFFLGEKVGSELAALDKLAQ